MLPGMAFKSFYASIIKTIKIFLTKRISIFRVPQMARITLTFPILLNAPDKSLRDMARMGSP